MKRKPHGPEQIIRKLREAEALLSEGKTVAEVCQWLEVSEQMFHRWRNQYGGMKAQEAKRLKKLEQENTAPRLTTLARTDRCLVTDRNKVGICECR